MNIIKKAKIAATMMFERWRFKQTMSRVARERTGTTKGIWQKVRSTLHSKTSKTMSLCPNCDSSNILTNSIGVYVRLECGNCHHYTELSDNVAEAKKELD